MITRPLDLVSRVSPPPRDVDYFAWVNVGLIALFFLLFGSRFVLAPGLPIGVGDGGRTIEPPTIGAASDTPGPSSVVVSVRRDNVVLFDGGVYSLPDLRKQMADYTKNHSGAVLLVRADRQVSVQALLDLCDMAKSVGFTSVLLAGESPVSENSPIK
jgi:biopolymer transport protein ExbD